MKKIALFFLATFLISNSMFAMADGPFKMPLLNLMEPTPTQLADIARNSDGSLTLYACLQIPAQIQITEQTGQVRLYNWTGRDIIITVIAIDEETKTALMENYRLRRNRSITFPAQVVMITMKKNNKRVRKTKKYDPFFAYRINFDAGLYFILDDEQEPLVRVGYF